MRTKNVTVELFCCLPLTLFIEMKGLLDPEFNVISVYVMSHSYLATSTTSVSYLL